MQRYLINALVIGVLVLLTGCQSSGTGASLFSPSSYPAFAPRMTLAQSVQDALVRSEDPVVAQVHVETNQNLVILSGYVKKIRQSDMAEQLARQVPGVQNVQNNMIVRQ